MSRTYYALMVEITTPNIKQKVGLIIDSLDKEENLSVIEFYFENSFFLTPNLKELFLRDKKKFIKEYVKYEYDMTPQVNSRLLRVLE